MMPFFKPCLCMLFVLICHRIVVAVAQPQNSTTSTTQVNVGVVLDFDTWLGKMGLTCIQMALSDFYAANGDRYKTRIVLHTRDSNRDVVGAAAAALDLIKNVEVQAILGPRTSMQADFVIALGQKSKVPIISFSASSPSLTAIRSPYFFRATTNDSAQVYAISALVQGFGWRQVIPIYVDNEYGQGLLPYLTDALQVVDAKVPYRSAISPTATDDQILEELYKLMTMQTRVFIVHMYPTLGSRLFLKAKQVGMMSEGYVWIITDEMTGLLSSMNETVIDSMQGVLGIKPYVSKSKKSETFKARWKKKFVQDNPDVVDPVLNVYGLWAYDAAVALAMAVEKAGGTNLEYQKATVSNNATDLESLGVSFNGANLVQTMSTTRFNGLTGDYFFVDGQLQSSTFHIMNVIGKGERGIGFWTPTSGLIKNLNSIGTNSVSNGVNLGTIIWPGDTMANPKGWQIPTNEKKLKIGVPIKGGFSEFVEVTIDPDTNTTKATGYCIDVFDAVMKALPYDVPYEYVPFAKPDGQSAGTYDDLVYQVNLKNFDAVVGDITIIYNRSKYVDFALPFTESGVQMVVPIRDNNSKNAWVFLKPLTWDLWVTTFCFFLFMGFVIWVLEHRINEDFRGPPSHQVGTSLWFSFSTMVFAQREKVISNLARVVVIIWCFVVLIVTQAYTASLTSLLTVQQLQPTVTDVNELLKMGESVGYLEGSFVLGILKSLGFPDDKLVIYSSSDELDELFQKGSGNNGIAAAFDEVPYMKLFLAQHCSKYTMIEPSFKTDGFGFAFPRGSPLVSDVSRAVLNVTEGDQMKQIEKKWFIQRNNCADSTPSISSSSLSLSSFWGLFLIVGIVAVLALLIFAATFLYEHRQILLPQSNSKPSIWRRTLNLLKIYNQRDLNSHTFKKNEVNDAVIFNLPPRMGASSPSIYSVQTDFPSMEYADSSPDRYEPQEEVTNTALPNQNPESTIAHL